MTATAESPTTTADLGPDDLLRVGTHNGHLMAAALKRHASKPVMYLGDTTAQEAWTHLSATTPYRHPDLGVLFNL